MRRAELQKHKFDERMKLGLIVILLAFAGYLSTTGSAMAGEVVTLIIGLVGGNAISK
jgi:hypothetical protein